MSNKENKSIYGDTLWLYFVLLVSLPDQTGNIVATIDKLFELSSIPEKHLNKALNNLESYKFITLKQLNHDYLLIHLNYLGE